MALASCIHVALATSTNKLLNVCQFSSLIIKSGCRNSLVVYKLFYSQNSHKYLSILVHDINTSVQLPPWVILSTVHQGIYTSVISVQGYWEGLWSVEQDRCNTVLILIKAHESKEEPLGTEKLGLNWFTLTFVTAVSLSLVMIYWVLPAIPSFITPHLPHPINSQHSM